jgi:hypothetical protein
MTPGEFSIRYFQELERLGIAYVILHSRERLAKGLTSDVDYAVPTSELGRLAGIQSRLAEGAGWRLAQVIEPHIYSLYSVVIDPEDAGAFVQLDACSHYVEKGCFFLPDRALLEGRAREGGLYAPAPAAEFAYLLAKGLAKGGPLGPRLPRLRGLWQRAPESCEARLQGLVGPVPGGLEGWFQRPAGEWEGLRPRLMERNRFGLGDRVRELARGWRRIVEPEGLHLGWVDAAGLEGTGLEELVVSRIERPFFRNRRVLGWGAALAGAEPPGGPGFGLAGRWWRRFTARVRNELAVSEARVDDLASEPRHFGRWLRRLRPRPDLTLLVVEGPEQIQARRPGIPLEDLRREQGQGLAPARGRKGWSVISSGGSVEAAGQAACREVIRFLAERERGRGR